MNRDILFYRPHTHKNTGMRICGFALFILLFLCMPIKSYSSLVTAEYNLTNTSIHFDNYVDDGLKLDEHWFRWRKPLLQASFPLFDPNLGTLEEIFFSYKVFMTVGAFASVFKDDRWSSSVSGSSILYTPSVHSDFGIPGVVSIGLDLFSYNIDTQWRDDSSDPYGLFGAQSNTAIDVNNLVSGLPSLSGLGLSRYFTGNGYVDFDLEWSGIALSFTPGYQEYGDYISASSIYIQLTADAKLIYVYDDQPPSSVPIPTTMILLGFGLMVLAGVNRRKQ